MSAGDHAPFEAVAAGERFSCALNAQGAAFCWGTNSFGELGTGTTDQATTPQAVVGEVTFASLSAAGRHTCALSPTGIAYCWGLNDVGELGTSAADVCTTVAGRQVECSLRPVPVAGDLRFASVDVGWEHTCGLTQDGT
ncbi:MAG: RCC1 domain-containing protein, partial [Gemmatimonadales bacterium]